MKMEGRGSPSPETLLLYHFSPTLDESAYGSAARPSNCKEERFEDWHKNNLAGGLFVWGGVQPSRIAGPRKCSASLSGGVNHLSLPKRW